MADEKPTLADNLLKKLGKLKLTHSNFQRKWQSAARFAMPSLLPIGSKKTAGATDPKPMDAIGSECATLLAAFIYSNTVYSSEQWFELRMPKGIGSDIDEIKRSEAEFLQKLAQRAMEIMADSNFESTYRDGLDPYTVLGTMVFHWELDQKHKLDCRSYGVQRSVYIGEDSKSKVDTVFREFDYTARQAIQEFGKENVSDDIRDAAKDMSKEDKIFKFVQCVYPRSEANLEKGKTDVKNKPFADIYIEAKTKKIVLEGGRDTFPYCVPRFYKDEVYGSSPAIRAASVMASVEIAKSAYMENLQFNAKPMIFGGIQAIERMDIFPGAINEWNSMQGDLKIWSPSGDLSSTADFVESERQAVRRMFYVDRIQYLEERKNMTATEVNLRYDEMIQAFSPVLSNLQQEFFSPFIEGLCKEIISRGLITVPSSFEAMNFEVEYKSRLNTKLKAAFNANLLQFIRIIGELAEISGDPSIMQIYMNMQKVILEIAKNCNLSEIALHTDEEIKAAQEAIKEQRQQEAMTKNIAPVDVQEEVKPNSLLAQGMTT